MSNSLEKRLVEVGYFLSRFGVDDPPPQLSATTWNEAYSKFYASFGHRKTEEEFRNSLKNLRDHFDSHLENSRRGWREGDELPQQLSSSNRRIFKELQRLSDDELWLRIQPYAVISYDSKIAKTKNRQIKKTQAKYFSSEFSGRKKLAGKEASEVTVNHGLVVDCLREFIARNNESALVYNTQKIDLALEIDGILKRIYEVKTSLDTQSVYTAVGQLFMHTAGANSISRWIVLPGPSNNEQLSQCLTELGINILWFSINRGDCKFELNN